VSEQTALCSAVTHVEPESLDGVRVRGHPELIGRRRADGSTMLAGSATMKSIRLPTLVLAVLALASVAVPAIASGGVRDGHYSGFVGPGYPIHFQVSSNGTVVKDLVVAFEATCSPGASQTAPLFHFKTLEVKDGKFSGASTDHFGTTVSDALRISGSFSGAKATGKVSDRSSIKSLPSCTQTEPFTAKLK